MVDLPDHMAAAVLKGPGRLDVEDVAVPAVGAGDVLVAVDLCGICGTDLHMVLDGWVHPAAGRDMSGPAPWPWSATESHAGAPVTSS